MLSSLIGHLYFSDLYLFFYGITKFAVFLFLFIFPGTLSCALRAPSLGTTGHCQMGPVPHWLASSRAEPHWPVQQQHRARSRFEVDAGEHCDGVAGRARTRRYSYSTRAKTRCHKPVARLPKVTASTVMVMADSRRGNELQMMTEPRIQGTGTRGKGLEGFAGSP